MLRELMNSTGITVTNVFLQNREALHYTRIAESLPLTSISTTYFSPTTLLSVVNQQVIVTGTQTMSVVGSPDQPPAARDRRALDAGTARWLRLCRRHFHYFARRRGIAAHRRADADGSGGARRSGPEPDG